MSVINHFILNQPGFRDPVAPPASPKKGRRPKSEALPVHIIRHINARMFSQREYAKMYGISKSMVNDIQNGYVYKGTK